MGSSWRYRHVAITPYSIGGFHGLALTFVTGSLVLFHRLTFRFDELAREFTRRWKTMGSHRRKQKNKSAQLTGPTFSQHFPTQVSPHVIQLDPIYYGLEYMTPYLLKSIVLKYTFWRVVLNRLYFLPLHSAMLVTKLGLPRTYSYIQYKL